MASGKEILLKYLKKYSLNFQEESDLEQASDYLRIALLLHGSTSDEMWHNMDNIEWGNKFEDGAIIEQGLKVKGKNIMLSDLFEQMIDDENIPLSLKKSYPHLLKEEYQSAIHIIYLILKSIEHNVYLSKIENEGNVDEKKLKTTFEAYQKKLQSFRENPNQFLGYDDE